LMYFGPLIDAFKQLTRVLSKNGLICLNVETDPDTSASQFALKPTGRFEHSANYLRQCCQQAGLEVLILDSIESRLDNNQPVRGLLLLARKA
jgi:predicted TPR repeat methyltransferase